MENCVQRSVDLILVLAVEMSLEWSDFLLNFQDYDWHNQPTRERERKNLKWMFCSCPAWKRRGWFILLWRKDLRKMNVWMAVRWHAIKRSFVNRERKVFSLTSVRSSRWDRSEFHQWRSNLVCTSDEISRIDVSNSHLSIEFLRINPIGEQEREK